MMRRARAWWRARRAKPRDLCEICAVPLPAKRCHEVTETFTDDTGDPEMPALGGSSMTATYCARHCPGGCQHDHEVHV